MTTATAKGHFPKRGERKINGEWVAPALPEPVKARPVQTAADRRNYLRKKAGWPPIRTKQRQIADE